MVFDKLKKTFNDSKEKVSDALNSDAAENVTDKVLDGAAGVANKVTGGKFADKIDEVRDSVDEKLGNE